MTKRAFGELEMAILQILSKGEKKSVKDVQRLLGGQDKYTTVMTVMNRLAEKKRLGRERAGMHYEYWIISSPDKTKSWLEQFKQKMLGYKTTAMVSYLIESADDITDEDLLEMEKMIAKAKERKRQ